MCFDARRRAPDGECPIVWMDHESIIPLDGRARERGAVEPFAQAVYASSREFLSDLFQPMPASKPSARG